jgi:hypothetical protein
MAIDSGLNGNFDLTKDTVDRIVSNKPGAYLLGKKNSDGTMMVHYAGRSDYDLNARLKNHVDNYPAFAFINLDTRKQAYDKECWLYHTFNPRDNSVHPAKPSDTSYTCSISGCTN